MEAHPFSVLFLLSLDAFQYTWDTSLAPALEFNGYFVRTILSLIKDIANEGIYIDWGCRSYKAVRSLYRLLDKQIQSENNQKEAQATS